MTPMIHKFDQSTALFLKTIGDYADSLGFSCYLVGGGVRDLLLDPTGAIEYDMMIVGDCSQFVLALHENWHSLFPALARPLKTLSFPKYLTAKLQFDYEISINSMQLDFSSARQEQYPGIDGTPIVTIGELGSDLARRDFSVNAIALSLAPKNFGKIIDPQNGLEDLKLKQLRILHQQSFRDDPARILRATRFISRLDLSLERNTEFSFNEAIKGSFLSRLPQIRLFDEFKKGLLEQDAPKWLKLIQELELLEQILLIQSLPEHFERSALKISEECDQLKSYEPLLVSLLIEQSAEDFKKILTSFNFSTKHINKLYLIQQRYA
jgi:tRNA nucleotidyltransferase (CCA-adding enzyme)